MYAPQLKCTCTHVLVHIQQQSHLNYNWLIHMWHVINSINEILCSCPLCDVWIHLPSLNYISNCAEPSFVELVLHFKASSHSVNAPISKYKIIFISFVHQVINWIWRESLSHVELMQIIKFVLNLNPAQQIVVFNTLLYLIKLAAWVSFFPHQIEIIIIFNWIYLLFRIVFFKPLFIYTV